MQVQPVVVDGEIAAYYAYGVQDPDAFLGAANDQWGIIAQHGLPYANGVRHEQWRVAPCPACASACSGACGCRVAYAAGHDVQDVITVTAYCAEEPGGSPAVSDPADASCPAHQTRPAIT